MIIILFELALYNQSISYYITVSTLYIKNIKLKKSSRIKSNQSTPKITTKQDMILTFNNNMTTIFYAACTMLMLSWLPQGASFHYETTVGIDELDNNVSSISMHDDGLVVVKGGLNDAQLLAYSSPNFTTKSIINPTGPLKSPPIIASPDQIYLNYGNYIDTIQIKKKKTVYDIDRIGQNKMAIIGNIAIFVRALSRSIQVYFINYVTNAVQKAQYSTGQSVNQHCFAHGLNSDHVLVIEDRYIFIIDINTKQNKSFYQSKLIQYPRSASIAYNASISNKLKIIVQAVSFTYFISTQFPSSNPIFIEKAIFNPTVGMKLFSPSNSIKSIQSGNNYQNEKNIGLSFYNFQKFYWRQIYDNLLNMDNSGQSSDQALIKKFPVVTFRNQSTFAVNLGGEDQLKVQIYDYDKITYKITSKFTITIPMGYCAIAQHSGQLTKDQTMLFGELILNGGSKFIVKLDLVNKNYSLIMQQTNQSKLQQCSGFAVIDNNYIVTLCNIVSKVSFELQLRNTLDLKIVSRLTVNSTQPQTQVLSNPAWDKMFFVQQFDSTRKNLIPTKKYEVLLQQKLIQYTGISTTSQLTVQTKTSSKYIISYLDRQFVDNGIYFISVDDLKRRGIIYYDRIREQRKYSVYVNKDIMVIQSGIQPFTVDVLDVSNDITKLGSFFTEYFQGQQRLYNNYQWMMFPQSGQLYLYNYLNPSTTAPIKAVYDLKNLPVSSHSGDNTKKCDAQLYVPVEEQQTDYRQNFLYYLSNKYIYFNDGVYPTQQYPLDIPADIEIRNAQFYFASNRKNLILRYQLRNYANRYRIQIRSANRPEQLVWYHISDDDTFFNVDLTPSKQIILNTNKDVQIFKLENSQAPFQYQMAQFTAVDVNRKKCMVMLGPNSRNDTFTTIIFKISYDSPYYSQAELADFKPKIVALHESNCDVFASHDGGSLVQVWRRSQNRQIEKISQFQYSNVESVKFNGNNQIVIFSQGKLFYENFNIPSSAPQIFNPSADSTIQSYSISKQGQYLAYTANNKLAFINNTVTSKTIGVFEVSQKSAINGLAFSEDNSLYISTNSTSLYVINSTNCSSDNFILINMHCVCPDATFDDSKGECSCPEGNYTSDWKCLGCEFPCATCQNQAKNCLSYSTTFYVVIIVPAVVLVAVIVIVVVWLKNKKKRTFVELEQEHEERSAGNKTLISGKESQK